MGEGDVYCEIETDKATMAFESTDDGFVAKLLVEAGTDTPTQTPLLVMVEEESDIPAFADYVPTAAPAAAAAAPAAVAAAAPAAAPVSAPTTAVASGAMWWGAQKFN